MTDTNASDTSQSVTRNYGEGRTDLTAGQERDTAADQSAQRPRSDGKDESTGKSHSGNGYQDRTTTRRSFSNSDTDTSTKGNDTSQDPSGQPAKQSLKSTTRLQVRWYPKMTVPDIETQRS